MNLFEQVTLQIFREGYNNGGTVRFGRNSYFINFELRVKRTKKAL